MTDLIQALKQKHHRVAVRGEELSCFLGRVPDAWIAAVQQESCAAVFEMWAEAAQELPLFWQYLHESLEAVVIIDGTVEPKLGYLFRDWVDENWGTFASGAMICALPTPATAIHAFEQSAGAIPAALKALWSRHGTLNFKDDSHLAQIDPPEIDLPLLPQVLDDRFLAIANPWRSVTRCLVREQGTMTWLDSVVEYYRHDSVAVDCQSPTIDRLLVDWPYQPYVRDFQK